MCKALADQQRRQLSSKHEANHFQNEIHCCFCLCHFVGRCLRSGKNRLTLREGNLTFICEFQQTNTVIHQSYSSSEVITVITEGVVISEYTSITTTTTREAVNFVESEAVRIAKKVSYNLQNNVSVLISGLTQPGHIALGNQLRTEVNLLAESISGVATQTPAAIQAAWSNVLQPELSTFANSIRDLLECKVNTINACASTVLAQVDSVSTQSIDQFNACVERFTQNVSAILITVEPKVDNLLQVVSNVVLQLIRNILSLLGGGSDVSVS